MKKIISILSVAAFLITSVFAQNEIKKEDGYLYICTYNVYVLGKLDKKYQAVDEDFDGNFSNEIPERIKNNAKVLATCDFDLIVIEEVKAGEAGEWAVKDLTNELNNTYNRNYKYMVSGSIGYGLGMNEAIAFIYNPKVINPELIDDRTSMFDYYECDVPKNRKYVRTQWEAGDFDFTLYACHFAWGNKPKRNADYEKIEEILKTKTPSAFSNDPDIIILGDFNRFGKGFTSIKGLDYDKDKFSAPNVTFWDDGFNIKTEVSKTDIIGKGVPNDNPQYLSTTCSNNTMVYDMILFTSDVNEEYNKPIVETKYNKDFGVIVYDEIGGTGYIDGAEKMDGTSLKEAYSDHRPLWMRFKMDTGNRDNISTDAPVSEAKYVGTKYGKKYHLRGCSTIAHSNLTEEWTTEEEASKERGACGVCKP